MRHLTLASRGGGLARLAAAIVALACSACTRPPFAPGDGVPAPAGIVRGTVTVTGVDATGDVYVFLLPQGSDPAACPAAGTSLVTPANVVRLAEEDVFLDPNGSSHSAEFTFPEVPPGCWSVAALVDADADFYPLLGVTAGATWGDAIGGAFAEPVPAPPARPELRVVALAAADGVAGAVEGVQVFVAADVPFERPSFEVDGAAPALSIAAGMGDAFRIEARPFSGALVDTADASLPLAPFFPIVLGRDDDMDYVPEDMDGDGAPDVRGSRVLLRRLDDGLPAAATPPAPWSFDEDFPLLVPVVIDPTAFIAIHMMMMLPPDGMTLLPATALDLVVVPVGFLAPPPGAAPEVLPLNVWESEAAGDPSRSPVGRYAIVAIIDATGQTWTLPNELMAAALVGAEADDTQGVAIEITP